MCVLFSFGLKNLIYRKNNAILTLILCTKYIILVWFILTQITIYSAYCLSCFVLLSLLCKQKGGILLLTRFICSNYVLLIKIETLNYSMWFVKFKFLLPLIAHINSQIELKQVCFDLVSQFKPQLCIMRHRKVRQYIFLRRDVLALSNIQHYH